MEYLFTQIGDTLNAAEISMMTALCLGTTLIDPAGAVPDEPEIQNFLDESATRLSQQ